LADQTGAAVVDIYDRMPVSLHPNDYDRWLSNADPDPRDLLVPYPAEPMTMWPISTRVNSPANDDALLTPVVTMRTTAFDPVQMQTAIRRL
jgi:putative SOS response-associated peptidase YedK